MSNFKIVSDYKKFEEVFLNENSRINLISKNDEKLLFEKHFYDSLSLKLFFNNYNFKPESILDIGTGGGFPAVPLAMEFPDLNITAIDSIRKKINSVQNICEALGLKNLTLINDRVENIKNQKFDLIVSRAVGKIDKMVEYSYPLLNPGGYIVLYKSKTVNDELDSAKPLIRKYQLKIKPMIEYTLPTQDNYSRVLFILQK